MKVFVLALALFATAVYAECPNGCNGHGKCDSNEQCQCQIEGIVINPDGNLDKKMPAWTGADCSLMTCPRGISWTKAESRNLCLDSTTKLQYRTDGACDSGDKAVTELVYCEHQKGVECSDKGLCNRQSGQCSCFPGYTGAACQRSSCPNDCSGHGICQSNVKFAQDATIQMQPKAFADHGFNADFWYLVSYDFAWDSGLHFGCKCDVGYRGPDCSLVECPSSDDPLDDFCPSYAATASWDDQLKAQQESLANIEFVGEEYYFSQAENNNVSPQMAPLPNKLLLYVENYINSNHLRTKTANVDQDVTKLASLNDCYLATYGAKKISIDRVVSEAEVENANKERYPYYRDTAGTAYDAKDDIAAASDKWNDNVYTNYKRCVRGYFCGGRSRGQPCSGRGLCNYADGTCQCHAGYAGNACQDVEELA